MKLFLCSICGYVAFDEVPEKCPVCESPKDKFEQKDNIFTESSEKSPEAAVKHIPVINVIKECKLVGGSCVDIVVKVGEVQHPMEEKHFIQFIDCYIDRKFAGRAHLTPALYAATAFHLKNTGSKVQIVEHCNVHGWWMSESSL